MKLYYTESYKYLAKKLEKYIPIGKFERKNFSDNESYFRFLDKIKNEDVFILGGTISDKEVLEIYDMACAASMYGANSINLIVPYFGYSTMERAVNNGEIVKAKTRARLFSSIPRAKTINNIYLLDLHVAGLVHYFENELHSIHMYGKDLIEKVIKDIDSENLVLASPDEGRVKWVSSLAKEFNLDFVIALKERNGEKTNGVIAHQVKNKDILIYDDMIRSGGTIENAVELYKKNGAAKIYVMTTHGVFTSDKLFSNRNIKKIYCSNSHANVNNYKKYKKLKIFCISDLIKEYIDENL